MSMSMLNQSVIREVQNTYYLTCDARSLSNKDLLVLILQPLLRNRDLSKEADLILEKGLHYVANLSEYELSTLLGIDANQSFHLMAVFELLSRMNKMRPTDEIFIRTPQDSAAALNDLKHLNKEHFVVLFLNMKNKVIGRETISVGTLNATLVHPREVFKAAMRQGSASIILAHNHPSGDPTPSFEDIKLTNRLVEAGELVGIEIRDHIIIGRDTHISLKEQGHICRRLIVE
ncbi:MAG: DNA repair protein RadC [Candidatus Pristimantibacillus sp.]